MTQATCCTHGVLALAFIVHLEPGIAGRHTMASGEPVKVHTLVGKAFCGSQDTPVFKQAPMAASTSPNWVGKGAGHELCMHTWLTSPLSFPSC